MAASTYYRLAVKARATLDTIAGAGILSNGRRTGHLGKYLIVDMFLKIGCILYPAAQLFFSNGQNKESGFFQLLEGNRMTKIKGNNDGPGGRNESYQIGSRKEVARSVAVKEVKAGKHPDAHVVKVNGQEYVRDNPDSSVKDNVNRK